MKHLRTIGLTLLFLTIGLIMSVLFGEQLRSIIQDFYTNLTGGRITFFGKGFYLISKWYYYLTFSCLTVAVWFLNRRKSFKQIGLTLMLTTIIFFATLALLCYIDGNLKLVQCTACNDGTRTLNINNGISYDLLISLSLVTSLLPSIWTKRKACV